MTPTACIYHKDCIDGTTAAAIVLRKFPGVQTFPLSHGHTAEDIEAIFERIPRNARIYIVDTVSGLEACLSRGHEVTVIDHHVSEHSRITEIAVNEPRLTYIFDNEKSGASLVWSYFFGEVPVPELIAHVEDSDLWLQKYPDTEDVNSYLSILRDNPAAILECIETDIRVIKERGAIITENTRRDVARFLELKPVMLTIGTHAVPAFNITNHQSRCGNILSESHNKAVALYTILGETVQLSFRGKDDQTPSSLDLASALGGGGHRNAAGARMRLSDFIQSIKYT